MCLLKCLLIFFVLFQDIYSQKDVINYYENLIKDGIEHSSKFHFPKDAKEYEPKNVLPEDFGEEFDYVVIGAGSAGAVVASRLSEIADWNVLLLEAGKDETNFTEIPSMGRYVLNSEYNWGFNSTPQKTCCLANNGVCPFPRGKSLGGTSAINSLVYCRGNKADYDKWAEEGNPGWAYKDVLPYFIKSENSHINGDKQFHGFNGNLNVNYHHPINLKTNIFLKANEELEIPILDYNGKNQLGASLTQFNTVNGRRDSSNRAFLKSAQRKNLKILTESYVTKILVTNGTRKAYGVIFSHKNIQYSVQAKKEVVLSAGIVGSPQILMLSGIGPREHLMKHGISVIKDLAVGETLLDQTVFYNTLFLTSKVNRNPNLREAIRQYLNGTGPLTTVDDNEALGFYHLRLTNSSAPDFEIVMIPSIISEYLNKTKIYGSHFHKKLLDIHLDTSRVSQLVTVLLHPKSRGKVYLKSSDPYEYPFIQSSCLDDSENEDIEKLYEGLKVTLRLLKTKSFRKLKPTLIPYQPCMKKNKLFSKDYWMCNIRETSMNAYHGTGTCKMGQDPSKGGVVDYRLRVHGIKNLRIADASIIPVTLSAHMNAPAMMIGERLADFIKRENNEVEKRKDDMVCLCNEEY